MQKKFFQVVIVFVFSCITCVFSSNTVSRDLPDSYIPGNTFEVTLEFIPDAGNPPTGALIRETLPEEWTITEFSPDYLYYTYLSPRTHKWLLWGGVQVEPLTITYTVNVPANAFGIQEFAGTLLISEGEVEITGDTTISKGELPGDVDQNGVIDISDAILCLRMAIGLDEVNLITADMNNSGVVDIADVILVLRAAIGLD